MLHASRLRASARGLVALLLVTVAGCSAPAGSEPDGADVASAETIASAPDTHGFVTPSLTPEEEDAVVATYTNLDPQHLVAASLLRKAVVYFDANKAHLTNQKAMAIVDFSRSSSKFRFYLIDMASGDVTEHKVAHGSGSDPNGNGMATRFSDTDGSHMSSLGFALGSEVYSGVHGRSLRLDGLSSTNASLRSRAIVIHGAAYVNDGSSSTGHSFGCFALDMHVKDAVIDALHGGALLYAGLENGG
jgi:hypothetical protein